MARFTTEERAARTLERNNLTEGPILKKLVLFALPMILSNLVFQLYNAADSAIVGKIVGKDALAAVSASFALMNLFNALFFGLALGTTVMVSQNFGAKRMDEIKKVVDTSALLGIFIGLFITVAGALLARPLLVLLDTPENIIDDSTTYLFIIFFGMLSNTLYQVGAGVLRALGDSVTPLYFLCISAAVNVALDLLFVAVFRMGVAGAALATIITQTISALLVLFRINSGKYPARINWRHLRIDKPSMKNIIRYGIPTALQNVAMSLGGVFMQRFANIFGSTFIAANSVVIKTDGFVILPMLGFGGAMTTYVGQNMGAGKADRAKQGIRIGMAIVFCFALLLGVALWFWGGLFMRVFTDDLEVLAIGRTGIRTLAFFYTLMGMAQIITGAMRGAGCSTVPMIFALVSTLGRIPFAYLVAVLPHNQNGLFWSVVFNFVVNFIMCLLYYKFGKWQKKKVLAPDE